jgi:hypothetical protein
MVFSEKFSNGLINIEISQRADLWFDLKESLLYRISILDCIFKQIEKILY